MRRRHIREGIGDTIRVSLTGDPVDEVTAGINILKSLDLRKGGITLVSCPTCGRTKVPLIRLVNEISKYRRKGRTRTYAIVRFACRRRKVFTRCRNGLRC